MNHRDRTTYLGRFANLKLDAFGIKQTLQYEADVEIYQARANPELWRARPTFSRHEHKWEASSADELMVIITRDFERVIKPWKAWEYVGPRTDRPQLARATSADERRAS